MKRKMILSSIAFLYIVLFCYAGVNKLLDVEKFEVQLGQSPMLNGYSEWVAWGIPLIEILLAILLLFPRTLIVALYASLGLMVMFTTYIVVITTYSYHIPCSCGGILASLGWAEHLIFNLLFIALALWGIMLDALLNKQTNFDRVDHVFYC